MNIIKTPRFSKKSSKLTKKIKRALAERIQLFIINPHDFILNNHRLSGEFEGYRSLNITGDYRLIYEPLDENTVRFIYIDTHHNLYGS